MDTPAPKLTRKDFTSDQEVRWCPGCGDYAILAAMQKALPDLVTHKEDVVFVSGIGCSSRFPYYMDTYGFHTIHGRAPAVATGLKLANPKLDVWLVTGDGDGLSIGGNHLMHVLRRNVDLQILLFNNRIYGLTKGQYSPTSAVGLRTPSTPMGSIDAPVTPCLFALGSGARFVARGFDVAQKALPELFARAHAHRGASFMEILQNCPVFNDEAFGAITDRETAADTQLWLEHGKPLTFGVGGSKGLRYRPGSTALEVVAVGDQPGQVPLDQLLVHDETNRALAFALAELSPEYGTPMAFGVLYCDPAPSYVEQVVRQVEQAKARAGTPDFDALLRAGHTWTVAADGTIV
jgi:2-oxoglutarate ferredoxin oxidoreductase subunit beta